VSVDTLLESEAQRQAEVKRVTAAIELETNKGKDVVVYTTRQVCPPSLPPSLPPPSLPPFYHFTLKREFVRQQSTSSVSAGGEQICS
jgi:hypothetical protein